MARGAMPPPGALRAQAPGPAPRLSAWAPPPAPDSFCGTRKHLLVLPNFLAAASAAHKAHKAKRGQRPRAALRRRSSGSGRLSRTPSAPRRARDGSRPLSRPRLAPRLHPRLRPRLHPRLHPRPRISTRAPANQRCESRRGARVEAAESARRPRKVIPLVFVERGVAGAGAGAEAGAGAGAGSGRAPRLALLEVVTSTLPSHRLRPAAFRLAPSAVPGPQNWRPFDYITHKPDTLEKLLLDAITVPAKFAFAREKIMGLRNYTKLFFPPEWMHEYCRNKRRSMEMFPNYAQMSRRSRVIGNVTVAQYIAYVLRFLREAGEFSNRGEEVWFDYGNSWHSW